MLWFLALAKSEETCRAEQIGSLPTPCQNIWASCLQRKMHLATCIQILCGRQDTQRWARPWHSCLCVDFSSNGCEEEKKSRGYLLVMSVFLIEQFPQNPTLRFAWSHFLNSNAEAYFGICSNMFHNSSQLIFFFFFSLWFLNVRFAVTCCACTRTWVCVGVLVCVSSLLR